MRRLDLIAVTQKQMTLIRKKAPATIKNNKYLKGNNGSMTLLFYSFILMARYQEVWLYAMFREGNLGCSI